MFSEKVKLQLMLFGEKTENLPTICESEVQSPFFFQGQSFQSWFLSLENLWHQNDKINIQRQQRFKTTILTAELVHGQSSPAAMQAASVSDETRP